MARSTPHAAAERPGTVSSVEQPKAPTEFGALVRQLRRAADMSQAELARGAGVSPGYVGLIETGDRGQRPSIDVVRRLCQTLGTDLHNTEALMRAAGHLGETEQLVREGRPSFQAFVSEEPLLTKRQRAMLIALYQSYVGGVD